MDLALYYSYQPEQMGIIRKTATIDLYRRVMEILIEAHRPVEEELDKAVEDMRVEAYLKADYQDINVCMARLIKFSPTFSELACKHMHAFLRHYRMDVLGKELNIVSIFDGPGDYTIGFINAMFEHQLLPKKMNVTMVNRHINLNTVFSFIISEERAFTNQNPLSTFLNRVKFSYKRITVKAVNCSEDNGRKVLEAISNADMTVALDILDDERESGLQSVEEIAGAVKVGTLLFLGNHVNLDNMEIFEDMLKSSFERLYFRREAGVMPRDKLIKGYPPLLTSLGTAAVFKKLPPASNSETEPQLLLL